MDNPFLKRILDGSLGTEEELRSLFRRSAKDLHPDTSPYTRDPAAFARLHAHYGEALEYLRQEAGRAAEAAGSPVEAAQAPGAAPEPPAGGVPATGQARSLFYDALRTLLARTWPFTRGREDADPSLRRHLQEAAAAWDAWQPGEKGLFAQVESWRKARIGQAGGGTASDQSVWQAVEAFLSAACHEAAANHLSQRKLLEHRAREALLKLGRREGTAPASRLAGLIMEDLRSRSPAGP